MGFELPPGDPDALDAGLAKLGSIAGTLHTSGGSIKSGFAAALSTWHGTRSDDFRKASAGMQLQVMEGSTALQNTTADLRGYARLLRSNTEQIKALKHQADVRNAQADAFAKNHAHSPDAVDLEYQHAATYVGSLEQQAEDLRGDVRRSALAVAGMVDAATDMAVPHSASLTPAEIGRRVDTTTGIAGIQAALAKGTLTADQAWGALATASTEVPEDAINADGSIDGNKLEDDVAKEEKENPAKKGLDTTLDYWTLATAAPGGWSLASLANAAREFTTAKSQLPVDLYKLTQKELDAIPKGPVQDADSLLREIEEGPKWTPADDAAVDAAGNLSKAEEAIGGLGKFEAVGRVFDGLAVVGDVWTLADPNSETDDKVDAGVNLTGLALTTDAGSGLAVDGLVASGLIGADAAVGWVPVVGWGLVAITAGYEVYKHWDTVTKYASTAYHATANFVTNTAPHALSSAAHSVGHFVTSHLPHIHIHNPF